MCLWAQLCSKYIINVYVHSGRRLDNSPTYMYVEVVSSSQLSQALLVFSVTQRQTAVTAYFSSKQLLLFVFALGLQYNEPSPLYVLCYVVNFVNVEASCSDCMYLCWRSWKSRGMIFVSCQYFRTCKKMCRFLRQNGRKWECVKLHLWHFCRRVTTSFASAA